MKTHFLTRFSICICWVLLGGYGCNHVDEGTCLTRVADLKDDYRQVWNLEYDENDRLVKYGDTSIRYERNKITVGEIRWKHYDEIMYGATYHLQDGRVTGSKVHCRIRNGADWCDVWKKNRYYYKDDTVSVVSDFYLYESSGLIRTIKIDYVYDEQNRLREILNVHFNNEGEEIGACHCYYDYKSNIHYSSNLNLKAYVVDMEGLDTFFYFLLNLDRRRRDDSLPDDIRHCVNRGKDTYTADGLYRLDGYTPTKFEVLSHCVKLKARFEFEHAALD